MTFNNELIAGKLRRWEKYLINYRLPNWEDIPDFGLYMEQVITLIKQYLDYLPPELKEEQFITAATINNYVRTKIMPEPIKKRYYRVHIAYLIIICTLKQSLSIAMIQKILPYGVEEDEFRSFYARYVECHRTSAQFFIEQIRLTAAPILEHDVDSPFCVDSAEDLVVLSAILGGLSRLLAEKLMLLDGKDLETGGAILKKNEKPETEA